ncbi:hypothetical protein V1478_018387 [Vespula squamosa]|uniref:Uncharacterized protein n=1 Tax=Vespula squamosa TaxID=30214 RepID=A0ABD1ZVF5_VESSQ
MTTVYDEGQSRDMRFSLKRTKREKEREEEEEEKEEEEEEERDRENSDWYVDGSKNDSLSRHHVHQKATSHRSTPDTTTTTSPQQKSFPFDDSRDPSAAGPRHLTSAPELKDQTLQL